MRRPSWLPVLAASLASLLAGPAKADPDQPAVTPAQIEADWLHHDAMRKTGATTGPQVEPEEDAPGGVDGIKNGKWGFHTENEENPWWQVDLEKPRPLDRIVLYNRCDECGPRNSRILVLASDDADNWRQLYQHDGTVFNGHTDGKPMVATLDGARAMGLTLAAGSTSGLLTSVLCMWLLLGLVARLLRNAGPLTTRILFPGKPRSTLAKPL